MSGRVLVDSSVWIDFLRNPRSRFSLRLDTLLEENRAAICGIVYAEVVSGARSARHFRELEDLMSALPILPEPPGLWVNAARARFQLKTKGVNSVGIPDLVVALTACGEKCPLLAIDRDYSRIAKVLPLELH